METLPEPEDPEVTLRQVPARRMTVVRYSGFWNEKGYSKNRDRLETWIMHRLFRSSNVNGSVIKNQEQSQSFGETSYIALTRIDAVI